MFNIPFEQMVDIICKMSKKSKEEIIKAVEEKRTELNGLVTNEGAAHIIANELGIKLVDMADKQDMQLKNLIPGLRNVTISGRVVRTYLPREWEKAGKKGKVGSFLITDNSGSARVVLWNDKADIIGKEVREGSTLRISYAFVKEGNYGPEIHLRDKSRIDLEPKDVQIKDEKTEKKNISDILENEQVSFRAAVVDFRDRNPFFEVCPECGRKVQNQNNVFSCNTHGNVIPKLSAVLNITADDGTGRIRVVLFGKKIEPLINMNLAEFYEKKLDLAMRNILGREFLFSGKSRKNSFSNELEILASYVQPINHSEEARNIINEKLQTEKS